MVLEPLLVLQQVNTPKTVVLVFSIPRMYVLECWEEVRTFSCSAHGGSRELEGSMS
jgi:hypothetical protein